MKKIEFDGDIYNKSAVIRAATGFSNVAKITVTQIGSKILCVLVSSKYNEETTIKEFGNYVIDCMNQRPVDERC